MLPKSDRALQHLVPLAADKRQNFSVSLEIQEAEHVQQHICRQSLYTAPMCLQVAFLICLEDAPAFLCAGSPFVILFAVFSDLGVTADCITTVS